MEPEKIENPRERFKLADSHSLLWTIDSLISITIISTLVVFYWRGCWQIMDEYLFPSNRVHSLLASISIGIGSALVFTLGQDSLSKVFHYRKSPISFFFFSRLCTFVHCATCVNHWRGVWMAWDVYSGTSWESGVASACIGVFLLGIIRALRNIVAPPFVVALDVPKGFFFVPLLFENEKKKSLAIQIFDGVFTVTVVNSLVVFVWRGSWVFLDRKLFPNNAAYSAWGSLAIGMAISIVFFLLQLIILPCAEKIKNLIIKVLIEDFYFTWCFAGAINVWRGVWLLLNVYLVPERPGLSNWISMLVGISILMLLCCSNSILVRGGLMDGTLEGAKGLTLSTKYLRFFFEARRMEDIRITDVEDSNSLVHLNALPLAPNKVNGRIEANPKT